jgi:Transposase DDE domain
MIFSTLFRFKWGPVAASLLRVLKRIRDYGWDFVWRLKKNRRFNGHAVRHHRRHPYGAEGGWLSGGLKVLVVRHGKQYYATSGGLKVLVVRHGKQYYATNHRTLAAVEVRPLYRVRAQIEELIRVCKDQLGLAGCQARSERTQTHHITCCLVAVCVLERERQDRRLSIYKLRRQLSCKGRSYALPALERLKRAA